MLVIAVIDGTEWWRLAFCRLIVFCFAKRTETPVRFFCFHYPIYVLY